MPLNGPSTTLRGIRVVVVCLDRRRVPPNACHLGVDLCLSLLASELVRASNLIDIIGDKPVNTQRVHLGSIVARLSLLSSLEYSKEYFTWWRSESIYSIFRANA